MAFNGSGVFVRLYNWTNDAAANIKIRADRMDNETNGIATGLSNCVTKDGQTTVTANLPMATFRHTGAGAGAARTDYTRLDQAQDGKLAWVDGGGTADAITANYTIPITTLVDGQLCYVRATAANATATPTFSPSALTARTIVKHGGAALVAGDIAADGHEIILRYDLTNTRWELMNPKATSVPFIAASSAGSASLAFAEDTDNGTNKLTLTAPSSLAFDATCTLPFAGGVLVAADNIATLTNKTLSQPNIIGVTSGAAAAAGSVGEILSATGTIVALTTATDINLCSVSLTAGIWDLTGASLFSGTGTTTVQQMTVGFNTVSATIPASTDDSYIRITSTFSAGQADNKVSAGIKRVSLSSTTTLYFVVRATFGVSTLTATGIINARRVY